MEFRDLKQQYQVLKSDIDQALVDVATSGAYIMGGPVKALEQELADYVGVKHCISCANGTDALTLALKCWGVGAGDAVFVPDFTFFASAEVIALEGATPVFVDVERNTFNLDPANLEAAIDAVRAEGLLHPKVVIGVDLFGLPARWNEIKAIAKREGLLVLEDGAQGFGGRIDNLRACSFGDIATTSFFPAKPLGCYGDGGALFTNNDEWAVLAESFRVHGKGSYKYDNIRIGMNSRLDTLQAAVLRVKLKAFKEHELNDVNHAAEYYSQLIEGMTRYSNKPLQYVVPEIPNGYVSSWAQYTLRLVSKDEEIRINRSVLQDILKRKGIPTMVYYPIPMSRQSAFKGYHRYVETPVAAELSQTVLSLPMHPYLKREEIREVVRELVNCL